MILINQYCWMSMHTLLGQLIHWRFLFDSNTPLALIEDHCPSVIVLINVKTKPKQNTNVV